MLTQKIALITIALIALGGCGDDKDDNPITPPDEKPEIAYFTGDIPIPEDQYNSIPLATIPSMGVLPEKVDLSSRFPEAGSQGRQGSCTAWAVAYLKTYQEKLERDWSLTSSNHIFSPAYIYNKIRLGDCDGGIATINALNLISEKGCSTLATMSYDDRTCDKLPSAAAEQEAGNYRIASWRRVNFQSISEVKTHLAAGFPIIIGFKVYGNLFTLGEKIYVVVAGPIE